MNERDSPELDYLDVNPNDLLTEDELNDLLQDYDVIVKTAENILAKEFKI